MVNENKEITLTQEALPGTYEEIFNFAKAFVASGMFTDTKQLSQAIVKIQAGRELGLPPVYSMQNMNMIRNRLTSSANAMAFLIKKSGHYNYRIKSHTEQECIITFYELDEGKWKEVGESRFSMADAKRADLIKPDSGWSKYPRAMLFSRAISQGARIYCPDAIGGLYTDEEIRSIPPRPDDTAEVINVDTSTGEVIEPPAEVHFCAIHSLNFFKHEKDGKIWYSHKTEDGKYCNEKKAEPTSPAPVAVKTESTTTEPPVHVVSTHVGPAEPPKQAPEGKTGQELANDEQWKIILELGHKLTGFKGKKDDDIIRAVCTSIRAEDTKSAKALDVAGIIANWENHLKQAKAPAQGKIMQDESGEPW